MKPILRYCPLLLNALSISSCCHGYWVTLQNASDTTKSISVTGFRLNLITQNRFVTTGNVYAPFIWANSKRMKIPIEIDSVQRSYSFRLPKGTKVYVDGGLGMPHPVTKIIINEKDTIPMIGNRQTIRKEHWLTYTTSYTNIIK